MDNYIREINSRSIMGIGKVVSRAVSLVKRGRAKVLMVIATSVTFLVSNASAASINWTEISDIINGVATNLFPAFITLITAAVPIIIVVSVVSFIVMFLDKILGMLKMR